MINESMTLNPQNTPGPLVEAFFLSTTGQSVTLMKFNMQTEKFPPILISGVKNIFLKELSKGQTHECMCKEMVNAFNLKPVTYIRKMCYCNGKPYPWKKMG